MALPIRKRPSLPLSLSHQEASVSLLSLSIRGKTEWKPQSQTTNQTDHMDHSLVSLNATMSHAMEGHPRWTGYGGQFWQKVIHWRRQWQTISVFLPWSPMNRMKRQKDRTLTDDLPRSVGPNMLLEKSGEITPEKLKRQSQSESNAQLGMWLVVEVKSNAVKNNIAQERGMLGPWINVNWK